MLSVYFPYLLAFALIVAVPILIFGLRKVQANLRAVGLELERCQLMLEISEDVGRFGSWHLNVTTNVVKWSDYIFDMHVDIPLETRCSKKRSIITIRLIGQWFNLLSSLPWSKERILSSAHELLPNREMNFPF